jgi:hypothetical protein
MIFVARMNMSDDQLSDTAKAIFESYNKRCRFEEKLEQEKYLQFKTEINCLFKILSESFIKFLESQSEQPEGNMHGTRDFYEMIRFVVYSLTASMLKNCDDIWKKLVKIAF